LQFFPFLFFFLVKRQKDYKKIKFDDETILLHLKNKNHLIRKLSVWIKKSSIKLQLDSWTHLCNFKIKREEQTNVLLMIVIGIRQQVYGNSGKRSSNKQKLNFNLDCLWMSCHCIKICVHVNIHCFAHKYQNHNMESLLGNHGPWE
jgi:hypothetical protein